jgi:hypothetical protein
MLGCVHKEHFQRGDKTMKHTPGLRLQLNRWQSWNMSSLDRWEKYGWHKSRDLPERQVEDTPRDMSTTPRRLFIRFVSDKLYLV